MKGQGPVALLILFLLGCIVVIQPPVTALQEPETPPARGGHAMAYDPQNEVTVLFGGYNFEGGYHSIGDTWVYSYQLNTWTELDLAVSPPARDSHSMVYCNGTNEIIMFGTYSVGDYADIWSFDCDTQTWSEIITTVSPGNHWCHAMAYDPEENAIILFGGFSGEGREGDDTWKFDLLTRDWTELHPATVPLARYGHVMVYDESIGLIVMSNGNTAYQGHQDDTWVYDTSANTWTEVSTTGDPGNLKWPGMVYDSINQRCILFGGQVGDDPVDETMVYNGQSETWTNAHPDSSPSRRITPGMAFDSANEVVILFGGAAPDYSPLGDTWAFSFDENTWTDMSTEPTGTSTTGTTGTDPANPTPLGIEVMLLFASPIIVAVAVVGIYFIRRR